MSDQLWTGEELEVLGLQFQPPASLQTWSASGVSIDSRSLAPGDLFVAIHGLARDGHEFVDAAFQAGASGALVDQPVAVTGAPLIYAEDSLKGLEALGAAARDRAPNAKRIAITGSVGKTGTKEALVHVLNGFGKTHGSIASYNNLWGVPLTLARMPRGAEFGVFEIGMNHAGEIIPLTKQVRPEIAIVTTVEPVHLEFFASVEEIADAKGEIFAGLQPGGTAILNHDNMHFERLKSHAANANAARIVTFGSGADVDLRLTHYERLDETARVSATVFGEPVDFQLSMPGRPIALNMMAVLGAVSVLGLSVKEAAARLQSILPPAGRGARESVGAPFGDFVLVDESYNANPASVRSALSNVAGMQPKAGGRRIAVLGDMLELGPTGPQLHADLAGALEGIDTVFTCGPLMKNLHDALSAGQKGVWAETSETLAGDVCAAIGAGDIVMVKGSLGSRMKTIVNRLRDLKTDMVETEE